MLDDRCNNYDVHNEQHETVNPNLKEHVHTLAFKGMREYVPAEDQPLPDYAHRDQLPSVPSLGVELVPREDQAKVDHVPKEILRRANLVKRHEDKRLDKEAERKIFIEFIP